MMRIKKRKKTMKKIMMMSLSLMIASVSYAAAIDSPIDCANKAYQGNFNLDQAVLLCSGATSNAPIDCANKAYQGNFNLDQAIKLCSGATSNAPIDCANKAYQGNFNLDQAARLCKERINLAH